MLIGARSGKAAFKARNLDAHLKVSKDQTFSTCNEFVIVVLTHIPHLAMENQL